MPEQQAFFFDASQWSKTTRFFYVWLPLFVCASIIFYLSTRTLHVPQYLPSQDKFLHTIAYMGLGGCCYRSLIKTFPQYFCRMIFLSISLVTVYGAGIEIYQPYCNRYFEWLDIAVNFLGAVLGTSSYHFIHKYFPL